MPANGAIARLELLTASLPERGNLLTLRTTILEGTATQASVSLDFSFPAWSERVHVLIPGAVYAGNRFPAIDATYPPLPPPLPADAPDQRPRITRVPRLSAEPGTSRIHIPSSDPAVPGIGLWFPDTGIGLWLLTPALNTLGLFGYRIEESPDRRSAVVSISSPCVREHAYSMCNDREASPDRPADLLAGTVVEIPVLAHTFECPDVQGLHERLALLRNTLTPPPAIRHDLPFSAAWDILEDKFNRENWIETDGYYAVGVEPMRSVSIHQDWQVGWVGGMIHTHALLLRGGATSRERALRNFDFLFQKGQAPSGLFYGVISKGRVIGDNFQDDDAPWHLLRKSADALFYGLASLRLLRARGDDHRIRREWIDGFARCADAFVRIWDENRQIGQFANHDTGELIVAGTCSAGIISAALVLAAKFIPARAADYLRVSRAAASLHDDRFLRAGLTNGGPGEIAQGADSESAAGLLESYVTLAEIDPGNPAWLDAARRTACQLASWVFGYDFPFPASCEFARLGMLTAGTVLANVQNKHSAPGLCTHSGLSLFRLHRLTGDTACMDLLRMIAHALPQYLSRVDRPIRWSIPYNEPASPDEHHLRPGWMCERVNVTQWGPTETVGEVFYYSCWSEVSLALTTAELPGIYVRSDLSRIWCLDHIHAEWTGDDRTTIRLHNPTDFPARVRVLIEDARAASILLEPDAPDHWELVELQPDGQTFLKIPGGVSAP